MRYFSTWFREPDYADDYQELYQVEMSLNGGVDYRQGYDLLSVWRLAHDPSYAKWAQRIGVTTCQLTFFGMEETTDWFYRRSGAFKEAITASVRLLEHGIAPRWQLFLTKRIIPDLPKLLSLARTLRLAERCDLLSRKFVIFVHDPSPVGEALHIEDLRVDQNDLGRIPKELLDSTVDHMRLVEPLFGTEAEWVADFRTSDEQPIGIHAPEVLWLLVTADWEVYPNLTTLGPSWRLGSITRDSPYDILCRYLDDSTPGQRALREESAKSLSSRYGDPLGARVYMSKDDLVDLYLERHLKTQHTG
jgi:MoaA/NifB/PqqE/SkfB family radical SAM enzyme